MVTPLPTDDVIDLDPPDAALAAHLVGGWIYAVAPDEGLTEFQHLLIEATVHAMTGHTIRVADVEPIGAAAFAAGLARKNLIFRTRIAHTLLLGALVLRPIPESVADRVGEFCRELGVDDGMLAIVHEFAHGDLGLAAMDFDRNGYTADWAAHQHASLHASVGLADAWQAVPNDPELAERWQRLCGLPPGTLGRGIVEMYRARGFAFPGMPGSAPPLLAQHDWVHVLADYGTQVESELEVFGFIARANGDPRGFSLFAMVVSLFETGYLATGAGLFEAFPGQMSRTGMADRVADALRRGAMSHGLDGDPDVDFMSLDWFEVADRTLDDLRVAFNIVAKAPEALSAGSVGPWEPGGISPFQLDAGKTLAILQNREYDSFGASV